MVGAADAARPSEEWLAEETTLTRADMLGLTSVIITIGLRVELADQDGFEDLELALVDSEGLTRLDMLFGEAHLKGIQDQPPGQQTKTLLELHKMMTGLFAEMAKDQAGGLFGNYKYAESEDEAVSTFILNREASDLVLSIGFESGGENHLYVTVFHDRVEFNPDCPPMKAGR